METTEKRAGSTTGLMDLLLRSGEALRNWRAVLTLMGTGVATSIVLIALTASGNGLLVAIGLLLACLMINIGISATGILLMDQALSISSRSIGAALLDGFFAALRLFVIALIVFAVALLAIIATAILLAICKIPGLGAFLYALVLPASVLVMAFIFACAYFALSLAGSAVWAGASIRQALSALYAIAAQRLVESALGVVVHTLLIAIVGSIVSAFVFMGTGTILGLSAGILGNNIGIPNLIMMSGGFRGDSLVYGGIFGFGILFALIGALLVSMQILGLNRLYLHLTANLDLASAEAALAERMDAAKERARTMQEETRRRTEEMRLRVQPQVQTESAIVQQAPRQPSPTCPNCGQTTAFGDKFCEHCGNKLA